MPDESFRQRTSREWPIFRLVQPLSWFLCCHFLITLSSIWLIWSLCFFLEPQFWGQPFYLLSLCQHLNISWRLCPTLEPHWSKLNTCQFDTRLPLSWRRQHRWFRWSLSRLFSVSSSDIGKTFLICFPWTRRHNEDESFFFIKWYQTHLIMFHYRVFLWLVSICAVIWRGM